MMWFLEFFTFSLQRSTGPSGVPKSLDTKQLDLALAHHLRFPAPAQHDAEVEQSGGEIETWPERPGSSYLGNKVTNSFY